MFLSRESIWIKILESFLSHEAIWNEILESHLSQESIWINELNLFESENHFESWVDLNQFLKAICESWVESESKLSENVLNRIEKMWVVAMCGSHWIFNNLKHLWQYLTFPVISQF